MAIIPDNSTFNCVSRPYDGVAHHVQIADIDNRIPGSSPAYQNHSNIKPSIR